MNYNLDCNDNMKKNYAFERINKIISSKGIKKVAYSICFVLLGFILLISVIACVLFAMRIAGKRSMEHRRTEEKANEETRLIEDYDYDPLVEHYLGKTYRYNKKLTNFLILGIDKQDSLGATEGIPGSGGQADVFLVAVLDEENKKLSIISIDRNTVTPVETFDSKGNSIGLSDRQITYAYAYGDGLHKSCELSSRAVSDLLFDVPVHAYCSMLLAAVSEINDAVGGVTIKMPLEMTLDNKTYAEGETVTLDGKLAGEFLRARSGLEDSSNTARLSRQKIYLMALIDSAISAIKKDFSLPLDLYKKISSNSCTDLDADEIVYLATIASNLKISYYSIKGTTDTSGSFDEFTPDYDALYKLVLDIFYVCED